MGIVNNSSARARACLLCAHTYHTHQNILLTHKTWHEEKHIFNFVFKLDSHLLCMPFFSLNSSFVGWVWFFFSFLMNFCATLFDKLIAIYFVRSLWAGIDHYHCNSETGDFYHERAFAYNKQHLHRFVLIHFTEIVFEVWMNVRFCMYTTVYVRYVMST